MEMRTKQEVIQFLESKVGTKVKCVGNASLDGQCVTLIKSLMEFLGVPDPYKARGHAKTCISAYINEGIAKQGTGFLTVFSNKDMGGGYGHVWCKAGDTTYESNGQKPLIVTKNITYTYDAVCNFDSYITSDSLPEASKELAECNLHKTNLQNQVNGLLKDLETQKGVISDTETKLGTANGRIQELTKQNEDLGQQLGSIRGELTTAIQKIDTQNKVINSYVNEDAVQLETLKRLERENYDIKTLLGGLLSHFAQLLKVSIGSESQEESIGKVIDAFDAFYSSSSLANDKISALEKEVKRLTTHKRPIEKLSNYEVLWILINRFLKRS